MSRAALLLGTLALAVPAGVVVGDFFNLPKIVPAAMAAQVAAPQEPKTIHLWVLFENGYEKDFGFVSGMRLEASGWLLCFTDSQGRKFELRRFGEGSTIVGYGTR